MFTEIHRKLKGSHISMSAYVTDIVNTYQNSFTIGRNVSLLGELAVDQNLRKFSNESAFVNKRAPKNLRLFEEVENVGTEVTYRCVKCRGCSECKKGGKIESISIQEEVEQCLIEKSVNMDLNAGCTIASLPFLCDPTKKLA